MMTLAATIVDQLGAITEEMRRQVETYVANAVADMRSKIAQELHEVQLARRDLEIVKLNFEKESTSRMALLRHGLDGVPGPMGPAGPQGEKGEQGPEGKMGPAGDAIIGPKGDKGEQGPMGSLPIARAWVEGVTLKGNVVAHGGGTYQALRDTAGLPGSADWICLAVPGVDGVDGLPGERGEMGIEGKQGPQGDPGAPGAPGERGEMGIEGKQGPAGERGEPGAPGERGEMGIEGKQGPQGERGEPGERGEMGIEGKQGPAGERGEMGIEGKQGPAGERGEMGIEGKQGPAGERGERGEMGIEGKQGLVGERGEMGLTGARGERGAPGIAGPRGDRGESIVGPRGEKGEKGERGERGTLPIVKAWKEGIHYKGAVVSHGGGTYQAERDTARPPGGEDWEPIAVPGIDGRDGVDGIDGRSFEHQGTYDPKRTDYKALDIVTLNSTWFMSTKNSPGPCPGADWRSGPVGVRGKSGDRGPAGPMGRAAPDPREIVEYVINERDYTITPVMSDGSLGPIIQARALFERYDAERD